MFRFPNQSKWAAACLGLTALLCTELLIESVDGAVEVWRQVAGLRLLVAQEASSQSQNQPAANWWSYLSQACRDESTSSAGFTPFAAVTTYPDSYMLPLGSGVILSRIPQDRAPAARRQHVRPSLMNLPPPSGPLG
jgi:hypothetical protein